MAIRIDGQETAQAVRSEIRGAVAAFTKKTGKIPGLAVVIVGDDPASQVYVRNKHRACEEVGIRSDVHALPADTSEAELLALIASLNADPTVNGILVQLPLPGHLNEEKVLLSIDPAKDVDAFHPVNVGRIMIGNFTLAPCTPAGVMELLRHYEIPVAGKHCVIIGRSNIVGKPQAMLMLKENATVTICHSRTVGLADITRTADILVAAVGRPGFVTADMVREGAVVIDVGINRTAEGKLCGDVDFAAVSEKAAYITPVPGGVGPMTITMLLKNTLTAAREQLNK